MGKAKLGVLLGGAYALGLAILAGCALAVASGNFAWVHPALGRVPQQLDRAGQLLRVAVHAGGMGVKALPAALGSPGCSTHKKVVRFCVRQAGVDSWLRKCDVAQGAQDATRAIFVSTFFRDDAR